MEKHKDGVVEETIFTCKFCGVEYEDEGHATTCFKSHLHWEDLEISNVAIQKGTDKVYPPGEAFPSRLIVRGKGLDSEAVYVLQGIGPVQHKGPDKSGSMMEFSKGG